MGTSVYAAVMAGLACRTRSANGHQFSLPSMHAAPAPIPVGDHLRVPNFVTLVTKELDISSEKQLIRQQTI